MANYDKIKIVNVKEVTLEGGKKFLAYKTVDPKTGNLIDLKFVSTVKNTPEEKCFIIVPEDAWNIARNKEYPVCWVKEISKIVPFTSEKKKDDEKFETVTPDEFDALIPF